MPFRWYRDTSGNVFRPLLQPVSGSPLGGSPLLLAVYCDGRSTAEDYASVAAGSVSVITALSSRKRTALSSLISAISEWRTEGLLV